MKSFILITVLAALTVCNDAAFIPNEAAPYGEGATVYQVGDISRQGPILLHDESYYAAAVANVSLNQEIVFNGNATTLITVVMIYNPQIQPIIGPLLANHVSITVRTPPGRELNCSVQIYGRII